jgi:hypothetical protein
VRAGNYVWRPKANRHIARSPGGWLRTLSLTPEFPASREFTRRISGFAVALRQQKRSLINDLQINSLRIRTGNFLLPNRELNQAFREFSGRIRESDLWLTFCPVPGARSPTALLGPSDLTLQPRSPKRLGHRIAASGRGIVPACGRLGGGTRRHLGVESRSRRLFRSRGIKQRRHEDLTNLWWCHHGTDGSNPVSSSKESSANLACSRCRYATEFAKASQVVKIISGEIEPP